MFQDWREYTPRGHAAASFETRLGKSHQICFPMSMVRRLKSEVQKFTWQDFKKRLTILNVLQAIWLFVVCISGAILVLVMFNMVYIADPALKDLWLEVNIQILNGCFTIMAIITQPFRAVLAYWTASFYYSKDDSKKSYYSTKIVLIIEVEFVLSCR